MCLRTATESNNDLAFMQQHVIRVALANHELCKVVMMHRLRRLERLTECFIGSPSIALPLGHCEFLALPQLEHLRHFRDGWYT